MQTPDDSERPCETQNVLKGILTEEFPNVPGEDLSLIGGADGQTWFEMIPFWQAYRPWLEARGFHLFEPRVDNLAYGYVLPSPPQCPAALPYAIYADFTFDRSSSRRPPPKFAPARDAHTRDVIIKLVEKGSDEYRIYEDMFYGSELSGNEFHGVLPPVAILDSRYNFSFVVMPRWGDYAPLVDFDTISGVLSLMHCLLKGLAFLHSHRIAHRDIDFHNIMVNYYTFGPYQTEFDRMLGEHRRGPNALHCLVDFDRSLKFSSDASLDACRLPAEAAMVSATPYQPPDLNLAEYDYDPFAFDVGCLGNMFRVSYADLVPVVPMLAPLFDQMTTHVISERFKAAGALMFFENMTRQLPGDVLDMQVKLEPTWDHVDDPNIYWSKVPTHISKAPGVYRTPPPSLARRILSAIGRYEIGWRILIFLRRVLRI